MKLFVFLWWKLGMWMSFVILWYGQRRLGQSTGWVCLFGTESVIWFGWDEVKWTQGGLLAHKMYILAKAWRLGKARTELTRVCLALSVGHRLDMGIGEGACMGGSGRLTRLDPSARCVGPSLEERLGVASWVWSVCGFRGPCAGYRICIGAKTFFEVILSGFATAMLKVIKTLVYTQHSHFGK